MTKFFGSGHHWALSTSRTDDNELDFSGDLVHSSAEAGAISSGVVELFGGEDDVVKVRALPAVHGDDVTDEYRAECTRPTALVLPTEGPRSMRKSPTLASLGLPEYLTPPDGDLYSLLSLLDSMPMPHLPALRPGDDVLVVTLGASYRDSDDVARRVESELADVGRLLDLASLRVEPWPEDLSGREERQAVAEISLAVAASRPRVVMLHTTPDCTPTRAYLACRSLPGVQLDLWGVIDAARPAAALSWGAPVAFVDGRPSTPDLWAAVCMSRFASRSGWNR
ncbi:MAG TPA: hypothetical protein VL068_04485 [Microthrixaceae bacterium]|nr:hypothetical protein [Microthrixaceae bacterium]